MGIAERREAGKKRMQSLILGAAMKLFLEKGFDNVSIRRIAEKIEYSPATIYLYYKDKSDILFALQAMGFEKFYTEQQAILSEKDMWKRLRKHAKVYLSFALKNPEYYDLMFIMRGPVKKMKEKKEWEIGRRSYEFLKKNVKEYMDTGYLKKTNLDVAAFAFWSLTHGIASLVIRDRCIMFPDNHLNAIIEGSLDFVMESIAKKKQ